MGQNCSFHNQDLILKNIEKMYPKISIIIVVFNGAKTIEKTLESVLGQTWRNLELIVVDGGSTDDTLEILKKIENPVLSWTSEPDKGIYDAMNKGLQKATGDWIYFLGADDEFYDRKVLSSVFEEAHFENIDFIYGNVKSDAFKGIYDGVFNYNKLLIKNISHQAIFYHKSIFLKNGNFNLKYKSHADWDFNLRCFEIKDIRIKYVDRIIAQFGEGGVSSNYDLPFLRESLMPRKLKLLQTEKNSLHNLKNYDEWWRFIRNAKLKSEDDFIKSGYILPIPGVILSMVNRQNKLSQSMLEKGVFSKIFMFINYLFSYHKIRN